MPPRWLYLLEVHQSHLKYFLKIQSLDKLQYIQGYPFTICSVTLKAEWNLGSGSSTFHLDLALIIWNEVLPSVLSIPGMQLPRNLKVTIIFFCPAMPKRPGYGEILFVVKLSPYLSYNCLDNLCLLVQGQAVETGTPLSTVSLLRLLHCFPKL